MNEKNYTVQELARLAKVTVRTLHHYDSIGLLVPFARTGAGYRLYCDEDLLRLQQILIWREMAMPLEQIRALLDDPTFDRQQALLQQREALLEKVQKTHAMIRSVEAALAVVDEETTMNPQEIFDGFDPSEHEEEAKRRWGTTSAFQESARRTKNYTPQDWERIKAADRELMEALAKKLQQGASAEDPEVLDLAEQHRLHMDRWYYPCSHAMHAGLAQLYTEDPRFAASFEKYGEGLAAFLATAIQANAARQ